MNMHKLFELASAVLFGVCVLTSVVSIHLEFSSFVARLSIIISMWCFLSMSWFGRKRIQKQKITNAILQKTLGIYSYFFFYFMLAITVVFTFKFLFIR